MCTSESNCFEVRKLDFHSEHAIEEYLRSSPVSSYLQKNGEQFLPTMFYGLYYVLL